MTDPITAELSVWNMHDLIKAEDIAARFVGNKRGGKWCGKTHLAELGGWERTFCGCAWLDSLDGAVLRSQVCRTCIRRATA